MFFGNKKVLTTFMVFVLIILFAGCSNQMSAPAELIVEVFDSNNEPISATVKLIDSETDQEIASKQGSSVAFTDIASGNYRIVALLTDSYESREKTIQFSGENEIVEIYFDFVGEQSVQEYIFEAGEEKQLTIPALEKNERVIMGVSPLVFDSMDGTYSDLFMEVERKEILSQNKDNLPVQGEGNPRYIYKPTSYSEMPRERIQDLYLSSIEGPIIDGFPRPEFEGTAEFEVGDAKVFNYQHLETLQWLEIPTTVRSEGDHCYIFVDDTLQQLTEDLINNIVDEFDNTIFENNTSFFNEKFDVDGNNKLGIVIIDMQQTEFGQGISYGFFNELDFLTQSEVDDMFPGEQMRTNEGDYIYLNAQFLELDDGVEQLYRTLAHEFQHELYLYKSVENGWKDKSEEEGWVEDIWINEGMATYAEQKNGYVDITHRIYYYFDEEDIPMSMVSLLFWDQQLVNYGIVNLFTNYLIDNYGPGVIKSIYEEAVDPVISIENYTGQDFENIFMDWMVATKLHSLDLAPEYNYRLPLEYDPSHTSIAPGYIGDVYSFKNAALKYFEIEGDGTEVEITFEGEVADKRLGVFLYRYAN